MKQGIHPDYHTITVKMTNGMTYETKSTYGKAGDVLQLDVDPNTHPAWTGQAGYINEKASRVANFNNKFAGLTFGGGKKIEGDDAPKAEKKKAEKK